MSRLSLIFITLLMLLSTLVKSQTSCARKLTESRIIYTEGRIHELPEMVRACLNNGFTDEEKTEAYKLLILAYIYLDDEKKAEENMLALLNHNHEFQVNEQADPAEFISLYKRFRTWPIYLWGVKAGGTYSIANVQKLFGANSAGTELTSYGSQPNIEVGFVFEKGLRNQRIGLMAKLLFTRNQYIVTKQFESDPVLDNAGNQIPREPFARVESNETKSWISLNLGGYYNISTKSRVSPRVFIGPSINYLIEDNAQIETAFNLGGEPATGPDEDLTGLRNPLNLGLMAGFNVRSKLGKYYLFLEGRYTHGLVNITEFNFDQTRLSTFYGYALDDVKISYFSLSIGLLFQKFNPKKLKN